MSLVTICVANIWLLVLKEMNSECCLLLFLPQIAVVLADRIGEQSGARWESPCHYLFQLLFRHYNRVYSQRDSQFPGCKSQNPVNYLAVSIDFWLMQRILEKSRLFSSSAKAMPGDKCPPVPPQIINTSVIILEPLLDELLTNDKDNLKSRQLKHTSKLNSTHHKK